jgi:hypothetical protein
MWSSSSSCHLLMTNRVNDANGTQAGIMNVTFALFKPEAARVWS